MAIFSRATESAADVSIFARTFGDQQAIAMQLRASFDEETALIVPLPVAVHKEEPLRFLPLQFYLPFFRHVERAFERDQVKERRRPDPEVEAAPRTVRFAHAVPTASLYVPSLADFAQLCPNHTLPEAVLDAHPAYRDYSFAVFIIPKGKNLRLAPLGVIFRTRYPGQTVFPTAQPGRAEECFWDHTLYCQGAELAGWEESARSAGELIRCDETWGMVDPNRLIQRRVIYGAGRNRDVRLALAEQG